MFMDVWCVSGWAQSAAAQSQGQSRFLIPGTSGSFTLMVRSPEADTMYLSSKSTTLTAARWPTSTRRRLMSVGEAMSQTAMERSLEQVTIRPLAKRRCSTASLWWISVFSTSPVVTSHTLDEEDDGGTREEKKVEEVREEIGRQ